MTDVALFSVAGIECAIELADLLNVAAYEEPCRLPGAPPSLLGISSFVERPILVVDLAAILSFPSSATADRSCVAIVRPARETDPACGFVVGALQGVVEEIVSPDATSVTGVPSQFVRRMLLHLGSPVPLLAVEKIEALVRGVER